MRHTMAFIFAVCVVLFAACSAGDRAPASQLPRLDGGSAGGAAAGRISSAPESARPQLSAPADKVASNSAAPSSEASLPSLDRMVIATVNMQVSVENAVNAARDAERVAQRYGGFVGTSTVRDIDSGREANMTLRIPSERLQDALADLRALGKKVTDESLSTQDVTEEYTDVDSNIRNLRATETQILSLMDRATKIEDVLALQKELTNTRGQIERLEGRRRVLENRTSYATVSIRLFEPAAAPRGGDWSLEETATRALGAFVRVSQGLATLLIWGAVFAPIWITLGLASWLIRSRRIGRRPVSQST